MYFGDKKGCQVLKEINICHIVAEKWKVKKITSLPLHCSKDGQMAMQDPVSAINTGQPRPAFPSLSKREREMAVTVYGPTVSTATARVIACLEEYGVEYRLVPVDLAAGEHKQRPHISRNPFGQVPVFEDDDIKLTESRAITRYIAKKYKGKGPDLLKEGNLLESAKVDMWMEVEAHQLEKAVSPIIFQVLVVPLLHGGIPDQKIIDESVKSVEKVLDVYEARLAESKYLAGDFFSLADLNHLPYLYYLTAMPYASVIASRPHVKAWWDDLLLRPACKKVTASMK